MWVYEGTEFSEEEANNYFGFVYIITDLDANKKYIGKKFFTKAKTNIVNKKKKRTRVQSDWLDYFGSNKVLIEEVKVKGQDNYRREILKLCQSKGECSYWEAKLQFQYDVLYSEDYYNEWIYCKIHKSHLRSKLK
jgi:hypothetical protein